MIDFYRRITINASFLFAGAVLANVGFFLSRVLLGRHMGPEAFGALAFLFATVSLVTMLADLGLPLSATREIAVARSGTDGDSSDRGKLIALIGSYQDTLFLTGTAGGLVCGSTVIFLPQSPLRDSPTAVAMLVGIWVFAPTMVKSAVAVFNGFQEMRFSMLCGLLQEPCKLMALIFLIISGKFSLVSLVVWWTAAYMFAMAAGVIIVRNFLMSRTGRLPRHRLDLTRSAGRIRTSIPFFLPFIGTAMMPALVVFCIRFVAGKTHTAWFAAGASLTSISFLVLRPVAQALLPAFSQRYARTGRPVEPEEGAQILRVLALFNGAVLAAFLLLGHYLIRWTYGQAFSGALPVLIILATAVFAESFRLGIDPVLNSVGAAPTVSKIEILRYAIMVPLVLVLAQHHGAPGAAVAVLVASAVCFAVRLVVFRQLVNVKCLGFMLRAVLLGSIFLLCWTKNVPAWITAPGFIAGGFLSGLYHCADIRMLVKTLRAHIPGSRG